MIALGTIEGPIFVAPDKSRGNVSDLTEVTGVSNVTLWCTERYSDS